MARGDTYRKREVPVGLADDVFRYGYLLPWETPGEGAFIGGPYDDSTTYRDLLWLDLRRSLRHAHVSVDQGTVLGWWCRGIQPADIPRLMPAEYVYKGRRQVPVPLTPERASYHVRQAKRKLERSGLGLLTVIYQELGGWRAVREMLRGR